MSWRQEPEPPIVIEHTTVNPVVEHTTVNPVVERSTVIEREVDTSSVPMAVAIVLGILVLVGLIGWWAVSANVTGTPPAIVSHTSNTKIIHEHEGGRAQTIIPPTINRTTIINPPATSNTSSNNGNGSTGSDDSNGNSNNSSSDDSPRSNTDSNSGSNSDNNDNSSPSNSNQSGSTTGGQ